jgi:hypothetical protein
MIGLFLGLTAKIDADATLVENSKPLATIVIAPDANEKVRHAADELRTYIEKISGARLAVTSDTQKIDGALILVGHSALTDALAIDIPSSLTSGRRDEGFVIVCKDNRLVLAGNNREPYHGTEYAVYDFLRSLGVRWFMPGEYGEIVPRSATIRVPEMSVREKPDFAMRNWWCHTSGTMGVTEALWKLRNKMGGKELFDIPGDSSVRGIVASADLIKTRPDLFAAEADGTRNPYLPNLSNPEAVKIAAEKIKKQLREKGGNSFGFAPDDGQPRDFSSTTSARNQGFVSLSGRAGVPAEVSISEEWFRFVNDVAAEVRKEFPDAYIATNGYANRDIPPQGVKLDDHLVVMFAAIWSCTLHAYDDEHCWLKERQGRMLRRWCELCPNVWVYGYAYNMLVSGLTPLPEFTKLRRDFPLMKKWGVMGFNDETRNIWAEPGIASKYLRAQLEWNANADVDAILDDFFTHWYGAAAAPMKAFYFALDKAFTGTSIHGHEDRIMPEIYTPALLEILKRHLEEAERLADSDRTKTHVRADRLIYEHLLAYCAMWDAEFAGDFARAAERAGRMLELRAALNRIDPFYIQPREDGYYTGVWY